MSESNDSTTNTETAKPSEGNTTNYKYEVLPEDATNFDLSFKLIVIGDCGVGKSCLTNNAIKNVFEDAYNATVGFEFITFNIKLNDKVIKLQIWDTCGQELYRSLVTNFYRNSSLAIMVYAINSKESFNNIEMWLRDLRTHSNPDAKVFLIGNKIDLEKERKVTKEEGEKFAKDNNLNLFLESSAKTGVNAQQIFIQAAKLLYEDYLSYQKKVEEAGQSTGMSQMQPEQNQKLTKNNFEEKEKGGCC